MWQNIQKYKWIRQSHNEVCESTCHEFSTKDEVENDRIVEKKDLILKKDMEHKEIMRERENLKIGSPQYEREFWKGNGN